jgi:hypothetical protein
MLLLSFWRLYRDESGTVVGIVGIISFVEPCFVLVIVVFHREFDKKNYLYYGADLVVQR